MPASCRPDSVVTRRRRSPASNVSRQPVSGALARR